MTDLPRLAIDQRAQSKMDKAARRFHARIDTDATPAQQMIYDPIDGSWRELNRG